MDIFIWLPTLLNCLSFFLLIFLQCIESFRGTYWQLDTKEWLIMYCINLKLNKLYPPPRKKSVCDLKMLKISKSPLMNSAGWLIHDGRRHLVRPNSSLGNGNTCIIERWFSASPRCLRDFKGIKNGAIKLHLLSCFAQTLDSKQESTSFRLDCVSNVVKRRNEWSWLVWKRLWNISSEIFKNWGDLVCFFL